MKAHPTHDGVRSRAYRRRRGAHRVHLAERVGLTADPVRCCERLGLLPAPERSAAGYRQYDEASARRLRFIKGAQRVGRRLRENGDLLRAVDEGQCACPDTEVPLRQRMADIDREMTRLAEVRAELARLVEEAPAAPMPARRCGASES